MLIARIPTQKQSPECDVSNLMVYLSAVVSLCKGDSHFQCLQKRNTIPPTTITPVMNTLQIGKVVPGMCESAIATPAKNAV